MPVPSVPAPKSGITAVAQLTLRPYYTSLSSSAPEPTFRMLQPCGVKFRTMVRLLDPTTSEKRGRDRGPQPFRCQIRYSFTVLQELALILARRSSLG